jgi:CelD/BcsL family acetyltransferase involved in cellulose biosynthesis
MRACWLALSSLLGQRAKIASPWPDEAVHVIALPSGEAVQTSSGPVLELATERGGLYVLERVAKPLADYEYALIDGEANQGAKHLSDACSLGLDRAP